MEQLFVKSGYADDSAPTGDAADNAGRVFGIPSVVDPSVGGGLRVGSVRAHLEFLDASLAAVAGVTCTAQLYFLDDSRAGAPKWLSVDVPIDTIGAGELVDFPFPALASPKQAFMRITNVSATPAFIRVTGEPGGAVKAAV